MTLTYEELINKGSNMTYEEFINKASNIEIKDFLNYCAENRVFPGDTSLHNYNLRVVWAERNLQTAKWIIDNDHFDCLAQLISIARDLLEELNFHNDSGSFKYERELDEWMNKFLKGEKK